MVSIRLARHGSKRSPHYRIVATDSRNPRDGRFIEILGHYAPTSPNKTLVLKDDRLQYWMSHGAQPSATVRRLMDQARQQTAEA